MLTGKELGDAIAKAIELKKVKKADVATEFGVKAPSVSGWIKTGRISKEHLDKLVTYFSDVVGPEHFGINFDVNVTQAPDIQPAIPLISSVQAGTWAEIIDNFQPGDADEWLNTTTKHSGSSFALKVSGESMKNPGSRYSFDDGDIILVDPEKPYHNGSLVVVRLNGDKKATFKKLIIEEGKMYLKALNPDWPDPIIPMTDEAQICGVVFEKIVRFP
ncbi:LexA family protein [Neisseria shayeganii]|uniref:Peptidase S24/S26 domain protein n=1 Tax=Neisseria shayeganii 871 TaxID=1032488 RepID=G4CG69_9NEIS|nr:S24 family peptidase [Neisseria shayeganii]EGY53117.1 peptidase S24/S26 domain protein [Neisseria shayeganii 871]